MVPLDNSVIFGAITLSNQISLQSVHCFNKISKTDYLFPKSANKTLMLTME